MPLFLFHAQLAERKGTFLRYYADLIAELDRIPVLSKERFARNLIYRLLGQGRYLLVVLLYR